MCKFLYSTNFHTIKPLTKPENCVFYFCLNLLCFWSHSPTDLERLTEMPLLCRSNTSCLSGVHVVISFY